MKKPDISQEALGENMGVTHRVVQKYISVLKEAGRIERVGGKRYGHWKKMIKDVAASGKNRKPLF